jgi:hypothetical protein
MATILNGVTLSAYTLVEYAFDSDALAYIAAVEAADSEQLEPRVRVAINDFVFGCKTDGIWSAIKASCIMAGARTLEGALVPLVGTAPTNVNFVSGDYNRKTGLVGDGSTKYLNSNRASNSDPQDNRHLSVFISAVGAVSQYYISNRESGLGTTHLLRRTSGTLLSRVSADTFGDSLTQVAVGFAGASRSLAASYIARNNSTNKIETISSDGVTADVFEVYRRGAGVGVLGYSSARLSFYSIGESLDLAKLDARVSALMTAFNNAIP